MGFEEKVKNIIIRLRAAGKTRKEVSETILLAAERATVTIEPPEYSGKIKAAGESLQDAFQKVGITVREAMATFECRCKPIRQEKSNNWRKYHGLPLKRSKGGKRRGDRKRNDSNSENAGIS